MDIYEAEVAYSTLFGYGYTSSVEALIENHLLDESVVQPDCVGVVTIYLFSGSSPGFEVVIESVDGTMTGHVSNDRYLWFS
jgi:hypothetical protein